MKVLMSMTTDMRELLGRVLERLDSIRVLPSHGKQTLEKAIAAKLDPEGDDADNGRAGKREPFAPILRRRRFLAINALIRPHDHRMCSDAGCNGYIVKPFSFVDLQRIVSRHRTEMGRAGNR